MFPDRLQQARVSCEEHVPETLHTAEARELPDGKTVIVPGAAEVLQLVSHLMDRDVDGVLLSPAFSYQTVDDEIFLTREETHQRFREILSGLNGARLYNTPLYLEFLKGERELGCSPWGNPTRTPQGWKQPCYLLTDGYCESFQDLMEKTEWERYGPGRDARCANCKMHSGFEASAVREMCRPGEMVKAMVRGFAPSFG